MERPTEPSARTEPTNGAEISRLELPRERLLRRGAQALSDAELVAVLLQNGGPGRSALDLARELLTHTGGLQALAGACPAGLVWSGIGPAKRATLLAVAEFACRLAAAAVPARAPLERPEAVVHYLDLRYGQRHQEVVGALYLDSRNRLLTECELYRGTVSRSVVEPRAVLREGLMRGASGIVLFHTHPSGDPTPSAEDLQFTRRLAEAGEVLGVTLVDHLIVGHGGRWISLRDRGAW
jgi:DNA repair protein RadC